MTLNASPGLVLAERVDYFTMNDGRKIVLPVTGVFVVRNGRITRFSDYFDLADFERLLCPLRERLAPRVA